MRAYFDGDFDIERWITFNYRKTWTVWVSECFISPSTIAVSHYKCMSMTMNDDTFIVQNDIISLIVVFVIQTARFCSIINYTKRAQKEISRMWESFKWIISLFRHRQKELVMVLDGFQWKTLQFQANERQQWKYFMNNSITMTPLKQLKDLKWAIEPLFLVQWLCIRIRWNTSFDWLICCSSVIHATHWNTERVSMFSSVECRVSNVGSHRRKRH